MGEFATSSSQRSVNPGVPNYPATTGDPDATRFSLGLQKSLRVPVRPQVHSPASDTGPLQPQLPSIRRRALVLTSAWCLRPAKWAPERPNPRLTQNGPLPALCVPCHPRCNDLCHWACNATAVPLRTPASRSATRARNNRTPAEAPGVRSQNPGVDRTEVHDFELRARNHGPLEPVLLELQLKISAMVGKVVMP